ncbi:MAG: hypothetical protein K6G84_01815 [Lachnospiraceae bacterium]|nr:hypothetical protein [Lachnospiraceae bacterium]
MASLKRTYIYTLEEFEKGRKQKLFADSFGKAYLLVDDVMEVSYPIHIDKGYIIQSGTVITLAGFKKAYGKEQLKVRYEPNTYGLLMA